MINLEINYRSILRIFFEKVEDENKFIDKLELFNFSPNFKRVNLTKEEYEIAKKIKKENIEISFYDIIHMLLAKQTNSVLITRDNLLIDLAKRYRVVVKKPEERIYEYREPKKIDWIAYNLSQINNIKESLKFIIKEVERCNNPPRKVGKPIDGKLYTKAVLACELFGLTERNGQGFIELFGEKAKRLSKNQFCILAAPIGYMKS